MSHHFFAPQPSLQPDVKCFAVIDIAQELFNQRIFLPDPYPGLVINCGAPLVLETENGGTVEMPRAFLLGLQTKPITIRVVGGDFLCVGLGLASWGGRLFVDKGVDLAAPFIPLSSEWQDLAGMLQSVLLRRGDCEAIAALEKIVTDVHEQRRADVAPVRSAVELLCTTNGQCDIDELAEHCFLSRSQLERRFNYLTGVSPKTMSRLIRFHAICHNMAWDSAHRMTDLVHKFGYVDQAHFIHEFQALAGYSPRKFIDYRRKLSIDADYMQFSCALEAAFV